MGSHAAFGNSAPSAESDKRVEQLALLRAGLASWIARHTTAVDAAAHVRTHLVSAPPLLVGSKIDFRLYFDLQSIKSMMIARYSDLRSIKSMMLARFFEYFSFNLRQVLILSFLFRLYFDLQSIKSVMIDRYSDL